MFRKINLILVGCGGHANACLDVIHNLKKYRVIGYIDKKQKNINLKYLGADNILTKFKNKHFLIGLGQIKKNPRIKIFNLLVKKNKLPTIISKNSYVSKSSYIGDGTIVMNNAHIGPNVRIGRNCIINTGAIIEHDVVISDHCHISTNATVNGGSQIGKNTFIGSGSVVKQDIKIKNNSFYNACTFINN